MNRKFGMYSSVLVLISTICFAVSMLIGNIYISYLSSLFISWGFIPMICSFAAFSKQEVKAASYSAVAFAVLYAAIIGLVYFAQLTTVYFTELSEQASAIIDYNSNGSLYFNYDLLGYAFMALATFFISFSIEKGGKSRLWLKWLLFIHGIFAVSCVLLPLLGIFNSEATGNANIGTIALVFWCIYFIPVAILSFKYFQRKIID